MTLRLLKTSMPTLRGSLPMIRRQAPEQIAQRMSGGALTRLRKRLMARSGGLCECPDCMDGYRIKLTMDTMEADHIVALHLGGTNSITNLRALHVECHARITAQQAADRARRARGWDHEPLPEYDMPVHRLPRGHDDDDMAC